MAATASDETVNLTDFHKTPGVYVDKSQLAPVILTKRNRRFAAVVSADYLDRAEVARSDEWKAAANSPWTERVRTHFQDHVRILAEAYDRSATTETM